MLCIIDARLRQTVDDPNISLYLTPDLPEKQTLLVPQRSLKRQPWSLIYAKSCAASRLVLTEPNARLDPGHKLSANPAQLAPRAGRQASPIVEVNRA